MYLFDPICILSPLISADVTESDLAEGGLPKYSGLAIGLGVCIGLLLLSGASVFFLNFTSNGGLSHCSHAIFGDPRKEDMAALSRLQNERSSTRNNSLRVLPIQRFNHTNPYDL